MSDILPPFCSAAVLLLVLLYRVGLRVVRCLCPPPRWIAFASAGAIAPCCGCICSSPSVAAGDSFRSHIIMEKLTPPGSWRRAPFTLGPSSARVLGDQLGMLRRRVQDLPPPPDVAPGLLRGYWVFPGVRDAHGRLVGWPLGVGTDPEVFWDDGELVQRAEAPLACPPGGAIGHLVTYVEDEMPGDEDQGVTGAPGDLAPPGDTASASSSDSEAVQLTILQVRHALVVPRLEFEPLRARYELSDDE